MNSPLIPQGSNLEQQSKARSSLKVKIFCAIGVNVAILLVLLMQGCKREQPPVENTTADANAPINNDTNAYTAYDSSNQPPADATYSGTSNVPTVTPEAIPQPPQVPVTPPPAATTEHKIEKGDSYYTIGKKFGVSMAALKAANPNVDPNKLKIGKTIVIPPPTASVPQSGATVVDAGSGATVYKVKSGDTLGKIATQFGTTVKAIQGANNLSDTKIKVGQELKIPAKQ